MPKRAERTEVLVIGGGVAGLSAARTLSHAGLRVEVIEGGGRLGGRIHTLHDAASPLPIELGAEFVHGEAEDTFAALDAAGLVAYQLPDRHHWAESGSLSTIPDFWDRLSRLRLAALRYVRRRGKDVAFSEYLMRGRVASNDRRLLQDFVEGYHAAHPELLSTRWFAGDPDEETGAAQKQYRLLDGYDRLVDWIRAGLDPSRATIRMNTLATHLDWSPGRVTVHARTLLGTTVGPFEATAAVVAVPHAVLQAEGLVIRPMPPALSRAMEYLHPGQVFKMVMRFRERFWAEESFLERRLKNAAGAADDLEFLHVPGAAVPTWWTAEPAHVPMLTAWAGGPKAEALLAEPPASQVRRVIRELSAALELPHARIEKLLEAWHSHDWRADPLSRAAYTYVGVDGAATQRALAKPFRGTLYLAGEATDAEQTGTVAGAIASGQRAAKQLLEAAKR